MSSRRDLLSPDKDEKLLLSRTLLVFFFVLAKGFADAKMLVYLAFAEKISMLFPKSICAPALRKFIY
jgi:hypothetical protein